MYNIFSRSGSPTAMTQSSNWRPQKFVSRNTCMQFMHIWPVTSCAGAHRLNYARSCYCQNSVAIVSSSSSSRRSSSSNESLVSRIAHLQVQYQWSFIYQLEMRPCRWPCNCHKSCLNIGSFYVGKRIQHKDQSQCTIVKTNVSSYMNT